MDEKLKFAVDLYKSGITLKEVLRTAHIEEKRLKRYLVQENLFRKRSETVRSAKSKAIINDDALNNLTAEALYWIGFLFADGHIEKDRPRITTTLSFKDKDHLIKMGKFFGENLEPRIVHGSGEHKQEEFLRLCFSSKKIYEQLKSLGFTNRKTWGIQIHENLKYSRDFWRGVIDGDGWIFKTKVTTIGICGNIETLEEFLKFIKWSGIKTETNPYKVKTREYLWTFDFHSHKAEQIANLLYKDATVYLDRKYKVYQEWLQN